MNPGCIMVMYKCIYVWTAPRTPCFTNDPILIRPDPDHKVGVHTEIDPKFGLTLNPIFVPSI